MCNRGPQAMHLGRMVRRLPTSFGIGSCEHDQQLRVDQQHVQREQQCSHHRPEHLRNGRQWSCDRIDPANSPLLLHALSGGVRYAIEEGDEFLGHSRPCEALDNPVQGSSTHFRTLLFRHRMELLDRIVQGIRVPFGQ